MVEVSKSFRYFWVVNINIAQKLSAKSLHDFVKFYAIVRSTLRQYKYFHTCSDSSWFEIIRASQLFKFQGLMAHVKENTESWHNFYDSTDPFGAVLPAPWDRLQGLEKIVILRCFRVDKVSLAVRKYIETNLGHAFTEIPPFDLSVSYGDSSPTKPLIFILSPGSDPLSKIEKLAKSMMVTDKLKVGKH